MRLVDDEKIKRVKREARNVIVEKGYHGASIAEIAKRANVSDGYLYRHYKGKPDLVKDILENQLKEFHDHVFSLLKICLNVRKVTEGIVSFLFKLNHVEPAAITFAHMLVYDHEFEYPKSRYEAIEKLASEILKLGLKTGEISTDRRELDILTTIFTIPVKSIEYRKKGYGGSIESESKEIEMLVNMCISALR